MSDELATLAEPFLWDVYQRDLEVRGHADAVQYLQHTLQARFIDAKPEGKSKRVRFGLYHRFSEYSASYNANTGEQMSWFFEALMTGLGNSKRTAECMKAAEYYAQPPPDARLAVSRYETQSNEPVFVARWEHEHNGVPVERDYIQVLVNGGSGYPFSMQRRWHDVDENQTVR